MIIGIAEYQNGKEKQYNLISQIKQKLLEKDGFIRLFFCPILCHTNSKS